jgi:transposase
VLRFRLMVKRGLHLQPQASEGEARAMDHFAGLDVSVKETSVCIVDDTGLIVREIKVASEPEDLLQVLSKPAYHFKRIGLEAGPLSQWLFSGLAEAGLPAICVETRHMRAVLKAQINKTDRNDARGMAQMMRAGLYRPVHVKTLRSQKLRMLLTHRKLLQSKAIAIDNDLRGTLRNFGLKVGVVGTVKFEARIKELVENHSDLAVHLPMVKGVRCQVTKQRKHIEVTRRRLLIARCLPHVSATPIGLRTKRRQTFGMKRGLAFGMTMKNQTCPVRSS